MKDLCRVLARWGLKRPLYNVNFTPVQEKLLQEVPGSYLTLIMRRMMVRLGNRMARETGGKSLITGESLGQVASQTIESLHSSSVLAEVPVFRPLIGLDKQEIIERAQHIGTYKTSILPHEDCCQVFVPKNPMTRPKIEKINEIEQGLDMEEELRAAWESTERIGLE